MHPTPAQLKCWTVSHFQSMSKLELGGILWNTNQRMKEKNERSFQLALYVEVKALARKKDDLIANGV